MAIPNISLSDRMTSWVDAQAEAHHDGNAGDYRGDLIRRDQDCQEKIDTMQTLVDEARTGEISDDTMRDIRERALFLARKSDTIAAQDVEEPFRAPLVRKGMILVKPADGDRVSLEDANAALGEIRDERGS